VQEQHEGGPHDSLILLCRAGDERAWRRLVDSYAGLVYAIARASRLPDDVCDDVAQATFAALSSNIHRLSDDRVLASWLRTTASRFCWRASKRVRSARALPAAHEPASTPDDPTLDRLEMHLRVRIALDELGGRCKELLTALYLAPDGAAYEQIGERLGMPHGSIGPTRRRCLAKLAELLGAAAGNDGRPSET
jgi:RNA polymerase sigma factor (sigma-70 family)